MTQNVIDTTLSGQTGTGSFVGSDSPILTTQADVDNLRLSGNTLSSTNTDGDVVVDPNGTGTLSSMKGIQFGGGSDILNYYDESATFTPTFSFTSVGDLGVVYTEQTGEYSRIGNLILMKARIAFTPTFTTATGAAYVGSFPFTVVSSSGGDISVFQTFTYSASRTWLVARPTAGTTYATILQNGSGVTGTSVSHLNCTSGVARTLDIWASYLI